MLSHQYRRLASRLARPSVTSSTNKPAVHRLFSTHVVGSGSSTTSSPSHLSASPPRHLSSYSGSPGGYMQTGHRPSTSDSKRFLVTGACGQIGSELVPYFRNIYGADNVIASDIKQHKGLIAQGPFVYLDVQQPDSLARVALEHRIDVIIHLASLLSAIGERNPFLALKVNTRGVENILEVARANGMAVYAPSSIAVYGPTTPKEQTPQTTITRPTTVYGITKVYTELIGEYYFHKFGVDFRSLRYPGIISSEAPPGGGTTDYAVEIYHAALKDKFYRCFLKETAEMPMIYMPDALRATHELICAPAKNLHQRSYNLTAMSFTPAQIAEVIKKEIPDFKMSYEPDFRQDIAESWPRSVDDSVAQKEWNWKPEFDLQSMTKHMLERLGEKGVSS